MRSQTTRMDTIRLTQFSHGAGCGCKLSPAVLHEILSGVDRSEVFENLIIGNDTKDDAAVLACWAVTSSGRLSELGEAFFRSFLRLFWG